MRRCQRFACIFALLSPLLTAQIITTLAGSDPVYHGFSGPALNAPLGSIYSVAVGPDGTVYAADFSNHVIVAITPAGTISVVAGTGVAGYSGDGGPATQAQIQNGECIRVDAQGNLFIADTSNRRVRKVSGGIITTVVGNGTLGFSGDGGPAASAQVGTVVALAIDPGGNLYVGDSTNHRVRKVSTSGTITTIAGSGVTTFSGDGGPATAAGIGGISGLAYDTASGFIYLSDSTYDRVRRFKEGGTISTYAGTGTCGITGDGGPATAATVCSGPLLLDGSGNLYVVDTSFSRIREISAATGNISTVAGSDPVLNTNGFFYGYAGDGGPATSAYLDYSYDAAFDASGNLYIGEYFGFRVRKVTGGIITTFAGNGNYHFGGDGGPAASALLNYTRTVAVDALGNVYVTDTNNNRIRKIDASGTITTFGGDGNGFSAGDGGPVSKAEFALPLGIVVDAAGNFYVSDGDGQKIRKISSNGIVSTIAGNGTPGFSGDGGPATSAQLNIPGALAIDSQGNIYFVDGSNFRIRKIATDGTISTAAGSGSAAFSGDGGPATSAGIVPRGIAVDAAGSLYIADDNQDNRIRKVTNGVITTFAGTGTSGFTGDGGPATAATLTNPSGMAFDSAGNLYVCNSTELRKITPQGIISRVAGTGTFGSGGDGGSPLNATIGCFGVNLDAAGNIYISDYSYRVRKITVAAALPAISVTPTSVNLSAQQGATATQTLQVSSTPAGVAFQASAATTSGGGWLSASPAAGITPGSITVTANAATLGAGTYQGTITIQASAANPATTTVNVTLTVTAAPAGQLIAPSSLELSAESGSGTQILTLSNSGGTTLNFTASASAVNGENLLTVSPASGSVSPLGNAPLTVSFNAPGLAPGVYTGTISINSGAITIPVELIVPPSGPVFVVGQSGLVLTAVAGTGNSPAQSVFVANTGTGAMPWTTAVVRGTGITAAPSSGSSTAGAATLSTFTVQANTVGLSAGSYYGLIQVAASGAANSPQFVSTVLNVLPAGSTPAIHIYPQALVLSGAASAAPASQTVALATGSATSVNVTAVVATQSGGNWLTLASSGISLAPSGTITVSASAAGLSAGVYNGTVTIVPSDGSPSQDVAVSFVVPANSGAAAQSTRSPAAATCTPSKLVLAMRQLANNFSSPVGWPVNLEGFLSDDCGNTVTSGTMVATFSNGDAALALPSLGAGFYSATWKPQNAAATIVTVRASQGSLTPAVVLLTGSIGLNNAPPPIIGSGGVVNAASFAPGADLAPGSIVSVFGANLGSANANATVLPLPTMLANIKLTIGGIDAPLFFSSSGQVNAQIPFELTPGSQSQVIPRAIPASGAEIDGLPEPIIVGAAHPGIFTTNGTQGAILNIANNLVDATHPAAAGDVIVIFCTGLGAVTPAASTGQPPATGAAALTPTVTIGGASATIQYAGVAPGLVGLYQVNALVPAGLGTNATAAVVITQNGIASNSGSIAVH